MTAGAHPKAPYTSQSHEMPSTRAGKSAMWLALAFVVGFVVNMGLVGAFGRTEMSSAFRAAMAAWGVLLMGSGVAAGVLGLIAAIKNRERSWAVMMAMIPGAFALFFLLGELLVPH